MSTHAVDQQIAGLNVAVLRGRLSSEPAARTLPSGARLVRLEVTVPVVDGADESVPVAWFDPPAHASALQAGVGVLVVGRARRRFFRAGGATASRTEVVADTVVPLRRPKAVRRSLEAAARSVDAALHAP